MKCTLRIPDLAHRQTYELYIKDGFRDSGRAGSIQDRLRDAEEQLEQMNYYHSIREEKERHNSNWQKHNLPLTETIAISTNFQQPQREVSNISAADQMARDKIDSKKHEIVLNWLEKYVPHLHMDDADTYAARLVDDGFDSVEIIEQELTDEDVSFMKKAHKRTIVRALKNSNTNQ